MRALAALISVSIGSAVFASNAAAQLLPSLPRLYAGVEAGSGKRHADDRSSERLIDGSTSERGLDYGAFVGVELPLPPLLFVGAELGVGRSEGDANATWFRGIELPQSVLVGVTERVRIKPRWNYAATARVGVSPLPGLGVYGLAG